VPTVNSENGIAQSEVRALKSALIDSQPLPLPPHSSDAAVVELHEMIMELRNFASNMLNGNPSPPFSSKGFMAGVMKSLQAQFQSLSLQARAVSPDEPASSLNAITQQLIDAKKRLEEADQTLKLHMETDTLTGLYNFSYLMKTLENEIERSRRYNEPLSIVLLDIDNFMKINDRHGYRIGDAVLEEIAALLRQILRPSDTAGRYSGGEFLLIFWKRFSFVKSGIFFPYVLYFSLEMISQTRMAEAVFRRPSEACFSGSLCGVPGPARSIL